MPLNKTVVLPPTFTKQWRMAIDALRGPPSTFQRLRELTERMRDGADLEAPDARAPAQPPPAPAAAENRRGAPPIYDWPHIERLHASFCRAYRAKNNHAPSWKERRVALEKELAKTPHLKTLQKRLPKLRY